MLHVKKRGDGPVSRKIHGNDIVTVGTGLVVFINVRMLLHSTDSLAAACELLTLRVRTV